VANFDTSQVALARLKASMECLVPQPEFREGSFNDDGVFERKVPGMVPLIPGVPYAINHTNVSPMFTQNSSSPLATLETRVLYHTWSSMQEYGDGDRLLEWFHQLELATWGDPKLEEAPIWELMKNNSRSSNRGKRGADSGDGSFSFGITVEDRDLGFLLVAKQSGDVRLVWRRNQILMACDAIASYMVERFCLPHELRIWRLLVEINNATTFGKGRLWSNVQLNHSTGIGNLADAIGTVQGQIHTDPGDWSPSFTVFILMVRFPKGE
jgi:hypothetical protein